MIPMSKQVTIYSTPACHFCQATKDFFKTHNIEYTDYNVAEDIEKRQEMQQKSGQMAVPVIVIGGDVMVGYDEEQLREKLSV